MGVESDANSIPSRDFLLPFSNFISDLNRSAADREVFFCDASVAGFLAVLKMHSTRAAPGNKFVTRSFRAGRAE